MGKIQTATCQDCGWQGPVEETKELRNVWDRVQPGDVMPAGECPEEGCGLAVPNIDLARSPDDEPVFPVLAEVRAVLAGVRIVADLRASLSAEGEVAQLPLGRIDDLVSGARTGRGQDYVADASRELSVVVAQGAFSFEHDEELFFRIVQMVGPRPLPGLEHHEGAPNLAGAELRSDSSQHRGEVPALPVLLERKFGKIDNRGILFHGEVLFQ